MISRNRATITSMAGELGLSTCTVSKILTKKLDGISYAAATVRRVEALAKKRNYRPNLHARSLRTRRSMTVGLILPSGLPYFCGLLAEKIEGRLRRHGYATLAAHSTSNVEAERGLLDMMVDKGVDGLLWIPFGRQVSPDSARIPARFPLVLLDRPGCSRRFPTVMTDNTGACRDLAVKIRDAGHTFPLVVSCDAEDESILERERGIAEVFAEGFTKLESANEIGAARASVACRIEDVRGRAVICLSQNLALGALEAIFAAKLRPGRDLGFASFDDLPACELWNPKLTRIAQDLDAMASEAVRLLIEKIGAPHLRQPLELRIPAKLLWGRSMPACSHLATAPSAR